MVPETIISKEDRACTSAMIQWYVTDAHWVKIILMPSTIVNKKKARKVRRESGDV